jgi:hypothetical protein
MTGDALRAIIRKTYLNGKDANRRDEVGGLSGAVTSEREGRVRGYFRDAFGSRTFRERQATKIPVQRRAMECLDRSWVVSIYWLTATKSLRAMHDTLLRVVECRG